MTPASILLAFLAVIAPTFVMYIGLKWLAYRRDAKIKAVQDAEMAAHDARLASMSKMSMREKGEAAGRTILRSVGRSQ